MNESIKTVCQALKEQAEAVISLTDKINQILQLNDNKDSAKTLEIIRLDEIEHIQNLTIEITKLISSSTALVSTSDTDNTKNGENANE
jgi:hypothetical protein|nr:MAG TPA: hypothetical protein [Caudoviricetes sp.]